MMLGDVLGQFRKEDEEIMRTLAPPQAAFNEFLLFLEEIKTHHGSTVVSTRGIGSSLFLGDPIWGKLGPSLSPQPYLGDSRPAYTQQVSQNPDKAFVDIGREQVTFFFLGSTAAIAPGSMTFGSGTLAWSSGDTALQYNLFTKPFDTYGRIGNKVGSFTAHMTSVDTGYDELSSSATPTLTSGVSFDGTDDVVSGAPNTLTSIISGTPFTVECWAKGTFDNNARTLVLKGRDTNPTTDWGLVSSLAVAAGSLEFFVKDTGGTNRTTSTSNPSNNVWHHIAGVYAGNGSLFLYKDGSLAGSSFANYAPQNTSQVITAGAQYNTLNAIQSEFLGSIDEIRVSNVRRYTVNFVVPSGQFTTDANTLLLWHFNEGTGTVAIDSSSSAISGTLVGNATWVNGNVYSSTVLDIGTYATRNVSISEVGIIGKSLFVRDTFSPVLLGSIGSEMKVDIVFSVGS